MTIVKIRGYNVKLDDEDVPMVKSYVWHLDSSVKRGKVYFFRVEQYYKEDGTRGSHRWMLHRMIMSTPVELVTDHIDGDTLNCQKSNMRICTQAENNKNMRGPKTNTSGFKGVSWHKGHKRWRADINVNCHQKSLGLFDTPEEAYKAYCEAKKKYHGEYIRFD